MAIEIELHHAPEESDKEQRDRDMKRGREDTCTVPGTTAATPTPSVAEYSTKAGEIILAQTK